MSLRMTRGDVGLGVDPGCCLLAYIAVRSFKKKKKKALGTAIHFSIFLKAGTSKCFLFIRRHYSLSSLIEKSIL